MEEVSGKQIDTNGFSDIPDFTDVSLLEEEGGGEPSDLPNNVFTASPGGAFSILCLLCAASTGTLAFVLGVFLVGLERRRKRFNNSVSVGWSAVHTKPVFYCNLREERKRDVNVRDKNTY